MQRLTLALLDEKLATSRTQAEDYIKIGLVRVNGKLMDNPDYIVKPNDKLKLSINVSYVSRAGLKLSSVAESLRLNFKDKVVLDVGSSTGGFTDFALRNGAKKVIAVDSGTNQMHPSLRDDLRIDLREQTDIRQVGKINDPIDLVMIDVSFISLREVMPAVVSLTNTGSLIVALFKPQFEAPSSALNKGIVKNNNLRRGLMRDFESWLGRQGLVVLDKADSSIEGSKGNAERFYLLKVSAKR